MKQPINCSLNTKYCILAMQNKLSISQIFLENTDTWRNLFYFVFSIICFKHYPKSNNKITIPLNKKITRQCPIC